MKKTITLVISVSLFTLILSSGLNAGIRAVGRSIKVQTGHSDEIRHISYSPDGKYIITADRRNRDVGLILWDARTGKEVRKYSSEITNTYKELLAFIGRISFSPDGKYFITPLSAYPKGSSIALWDFSSGKIVKTHPVEAVFDAVISPDGKNIVFSDGKNIRILEIASWKEVKSISTGSHCGRILALSPDGGQVVTGTSSSDAEVKLWNLATGMNLKTLQEDETNNSFVDNITSLHFTPDGKRIVICGKRLSIWEPFSGKRIILSKGVYEMKTALSGDGKYLLSQESDGKLNLWDAVKGKKIRELRKNFSNSTYNAKDASVAISPDGKYGVYKMGRYLDQIELSTGKEVKTYSGRTAEVKCAMFSPDGKKILTATNFWTNRNDMAFIRSLILWDVEMNESPRVLLDDRYSIESAIFSPDGSEILALSSLKQTVIHLDVRNGKILHEFPSKTPTFAVFTPDGKYIIIEERGWQVNYSSNDPALTIYDRSTGDEIKTVKHRDKGHFYTIEFLQSAGQMSLSVVDIINNGKTSSTLVWTYPGFEELSVVPGTKEQNLKRPKYLNSLGLSHDGRFIVVGAVDNTVLLIEAATGKEIKKFIGHENWINSISFSSDDRYILSGSSDSLARIWNIDTGEWTSLASNEDGSQWIIFNSRGYWDSSNNGGDLVAMTDGNNCWSIDQFAIKDNRPDIVSSLLPFSDEKTRDHYYRQYLKRLKRSGLVDSSGNPDDSLLFKDNHVPASEITSSRVTGKFAEIKVTLSDDQLSLKKYNIYVNDVPIFGAEGKPLSGQTYDINEKVELTAGVNKIEISCTNIKGAESYRTSVVEDYKPAGKPKSNLYYIGFGVSKYKNPGIRELRYAHKDAIDLASAYKKMKGAYAGIYTYTFIDEECTVANIKKAKSLLKDAKADDTIVLFIAGHGVHDTDRDAAYYFITHETDMGNLAGTAAEFDIIENILQGVAPRKKIFLMDTCESGEIEDAIHAGYTAMADSNGIIPRSLKIEGKGGKKSEKRTYLFSRDRYIYNDLVRRSGAVVFSSSRGVSSHMKVKRLRTDFSPIRLLRVLRVNQQTKTMTRLYPLTRCGIMFLTR